MEPRPVVHQGRPYILLKEPLGLSEKVVLAPTQLAPLLALCDGTRDSEALRASLALRTGISLSSAQLTQFLDRLDEALLLDNGSYRRALDAALRRYREAPHRLPNHAGAAYPADAETLKATIAGYLAATPAPAVTGRAGEYLVGVVCPHIDYARGHATYAQLWQSAAPGLDDVELVIIFGTDHSGSPGAVTLTRQHYSTPLGPLPTDRRLVDGLAQVLGEEAAFAEEFHHAREHSIELAAVWLHYFLQGRACPTLPVLCGSFSHLTDGASDPGGEAAIEGVLSYLREATAGRRTLAVAAGDLAHVGPAFGDPLPVDLVGRANLTARDAESIAAIAEGNGTRLLELSRAEGDARRLCGLPPIYMMLRYLDGALGSTMGYAHCAADAQGGSLVSIVGALLYGSP